MTTRVRDLPFDDFVEQVSRDGLGIALGPFTACIRSDVAEIHDPLFQLYADHPCLQPDGVFSFRVSLNVARRVRGIFRRKVRFTVDGRVAHEDMPVGHALPVLEWGMNLVIALRSHCFLMLHSAVLERRGFAMLLPAAPGSGKSTLCAGLSIGGWRAFSDEFGLIRPGSGNMLPIPRPIALKDESISVIRRLGGDTYIGPVSYGTRKGDVAHMKPMSESVQRQSEPAPVNLIVFPHWEHGSETRLEALSPAEGFALVAANAFNYELLGEPAFRAVADLVSEARCFRLTYSDIQDAGQRLSQIQDHIIDSR